MRIEGCSRDAATGDRPDQRAFRGELELNGLLVSQGNDEYKAWTDTTLQRDGISYDLTTVAHLKRSATTRLYLDAHVAGKQVRFRIYSGSLHLQAASGPYVHQGVSQPGGTMDIPVNGAAALLGLQLRSSIEDAKLQAQHTASRWSSHLARQLRNCFVRRPARRRSVWWMASACASPASSSGFNGSSCRASVA
ncbi:MAG: hypothetical protein V9E82_01945 [Candidatus Nanopelagicales bacterium]